jgi:hypothetical protein
MKRSLNVWTEAGFSEKHFVTQNSGHEVCCTWVYCHTLGQISYFRFFVAEFFNMASNDGIKGWSNSAKITNTYHKACVNHLGFFPNNFIRLNSTRLWY